MPTSNEYLAKIIREIMPLVQEESTSDIKNIYELICEYKSNRNPIINNPIIFKEGAKHRFYQNLWKGQYIKEVPQNDEKAIWIKSTLSGRKQSALYYFLIEYNYLATIGYNEPINVKRFIQGLFQNPKETPSCSEFEFNKCKINAGTWNKFGEWLQRKNL